MLSHEVYLLEFIGGGSRVTPAERDDVAQAIANAMRTNPQKWSAIDVEEQRATASIEKNDPAANNATREVSRYNYAFKDPSLATYPEIFLLEKRIIESHDPVMVLWRWTEQLELLGNEWGARNLPAGRKFDGNHGSLRVHGCDSARRRPERVHLRH